MIVLTVLMVTTIILVRLSYTDWLKKVVEVPVTLYATGFLTCAYLFQQRYFEFLFFTIFFILAWHIAKPFFENKKIIAAGDISVLSFIIPTTWFIHPYMTPYFLCMFGVTALAWYRKDLTNKNEKPMIPIITIAFILAWILTKITTGTP